MPTLLRSQSKVLKEDKNIVAVTGSNVTLFAFEVAWE